MTNNHIEIASNELPATIPFLTLSALLGVTSAATAITYVMYEFETDGFLSSSTMMFQGGKLINKSQIELDGGSDIEITLDQFNQIENGIYDIRRSN